MRLYRPKRLNVIILIPVVVAVAQNDGCSTTEPVALNKEEVVATVSGNTAKLLDEETYALVGADGSLKGLNIASGGTVGRWRVDDDGRLCAGWNKPADRPEVCHQVTFLGDDQYQWGDANLQFLQGNPKNL